MCCALVGWAVWLHRARDLADRLLAAVQALPAGRARMPVSIWSGRLAAEARERAAELTALASGSGLGTDLVRSLLRGSRALILKMR